MKELGVAVFSCECLAEDLMKVMSVYWEMGAPGKKLPSSWPNELATSYNARNPVVATLNGEQNDVYISVIFLVLQLLDISNQVAKRMSDRDL